jgi:hypothetical protein
MAQIYKLADDFTFSGSEETFSQLQAMLAGLEVRSTAARPRCARPDACATRVQLDEALLTASAFSNMLNLHNLSEEVANSERERLQRLGEVARGQVKTTNGTLETLLDAGISADTIYKSLCEQTVDLVFTAHPTQALRRSMLKNFQATRSELDRLHRTRLTRYERLEVQGSIRAHVQAAWRTDEIRRSAPTPQDEARGGLCYFQETIFAGVPRFLRRLDSALANIGQPRMPVDHALFRFSSWMAGDRDGNPFVTASCTRDAVALARFTVRWARSVRSALGSPAPRRLPLFTSRRLRRSCLSSPCGAPMRSCTCVSPKSATPCRTWTRTRPPASSTSASGATTPTSGGPFHPTSPTAWSCPKCATGCTRRARCCSRSSRAARPAGAGSPPIAPPTSCCSRS